MIVGVVIGATLAATMAAGNCLSRLKACRLRQRTRPIR